MKKDIIIERIIWPVFALAFFVIVMTTANSIKVEAATKTKVATFADIVNTPSLKGKLVVTSGYAQSGDGGGATYLIDSNAGDNSVVNFELGNGLYAHLQYGATVNVAALGILPGEECSAKLNAAINFFQNGSKTLQFNDGEYLFSDQVFLKSIKLEGKTNTVFRVLPDFNPGASRIFLTDIRKHDIRYNISIRKINFLFEAVKGHTLSGKTAILLGLNDVSSCKIIDCTFSAVPGNVNPAFMTCQLVWFQENTNENITISNCTFNNQLGKVKETASDELLSGGCLWFSGNGLQHRLNNLNIRNCSFTTTLTDEAVAIWNLSCKNVAITDCEIKNEYYFSQNVISIYNCAASKVSINKCVFSIDAPATSVVKIFGLQEKSDILFNKCEFDISTGSVDKPMYSIFYTNDGKAGSDSGKVIRIDNCSVIGENGASYNCLVNIQNVKGYSFYFDKLEMTLSLQNAMVNLGHSDGCIVSITNSDLNVPTQLTSMTNLSNCDIKYDSNTISGNYTSQANIAVSGSFTFTNNKCKGEGEVWFSNYANVGEYVRNEKNNTFE